MTMTDTILFVKETQTCHYVMHIATPRLCGEPGFKSRLDAREETFIRCREILDQDAYEAADRTLPPADHPFRMPKRSKQPVIAPAPHQPPPAVGGYKKAEDPKIKKQHDLIRKALQKLLGGSGGEMKAGEVYVEPIGDGDEEVIIEFVEADYDDDAEDTTSDEKDGSGAASGNGKGKKGKAAAPSIEEVLRAAGYTVKGEKNTKEEKSGSGSSSRSDAGSQGRKGEQKRGRREEL